MEYATLCVANGSTAAGYTCTKGIALSVNNGIDPNNANNYAEPD